jgi:hypothetical protein
VNDEAARQGRPDDYRFRTQSVEAGSARPRLRPFRFLLARGDEVLEVRFHAAGEQNALEAASAWATMHGWAVEGSA